MCPSIACGGGRWQLNLSFSFLTKKNRSFDKAGWGDEAQAQPGKL
jgi:hypothetical protein